MSHPVIRFRNATIGYPHQVALSDLTLDVEEGEFLGIIGPNGSGKTTLLKAVLGLLTPISGTVQVFDCHCSELRCSHRARIGYLPQKEPIDPDFPLTVLETVTMGRYGAIGLFKRPGRSDREIALLSLSQVGMEPYRDAPLGHLSGGQQQRVLIARAIAQQPEILLLDEPTTGIDLPTQQNLLELIRSLQKELRLTVLLVTHDINMVRPWADRLALLKTRLYAVGPPKEVLTRETLSQIYGKEILFTEKDEVVVSDYHHR
jgi:ABC-type Mn2+/Zn2+ transport system ATPase subunit